MEHVKPKEFVEPVTAILDTESGRWWTRYEIWTRLQADYPTDAERIRTHVQSYERPESNNEHWFLSKIADHIAHLPDYEVRQIEDVPEMNRPGIYGLVLRKRA